MVHVTATQPVRPGTGRALVVGRVDSDSCSRDDGMAALRRRPLTTAPSYLSVVSAAATPPSPPRARHSRASSRGRRRAGRVRLTARGRAMVITVAALTLAAVAGLCLAGAAGWLGSSAGAAVVGSARPSQTVIVKPGDTLWSIARDLRPEQSTWSTVRALREANGLDSALIHPGQELVVPPADAP